MAGFPELPEDWRNTEMLNYLKSYYERKRPLDDFENNLSYWYTVTDSNNTLEELLEWLQMVDPNRAVELKHLVTILVSIRDSS